jgi:hypothetical protein
MKDSKTREMNRRRRKNERKSSRSELAKNDVEQKRSRSRMKQT